MKVLLGQQSRAPYRVFVRALCRVFYKASLVVHVISIERMWLFVFLKVNLTQAVGLCIAVGAMIYNFVDKGKKKGGEHLPASPPSSRPYPIYNVYPSASKTSFGARIVELVLFSVTLSPELWRTTDPIRGRELLWGYSPSPFVTLNYPVKGQ